MHAGVCAQVDSRMTKTFQTAMEKMRIRNDIWEYSEAIVYIRGGFREVFSGSAPVYTVKQNLYFVISLNLSSYIFCTVCDQTFFVLC